MQRCRAERNGQGVAPRSTPPPKLAQATGLLAASFTPRHPSGAVSTSTSTAQEAHAISHAISMAMAPEAVTPPAVTPRDSSGAFGYWEAAEPGYGYAPQHGQVCPGSLDPWIMVKMVDGAPGSRSGPRGHSPPQDALPRAHRAALSWAREESPRRVGAKEGRRRPGAPPKVPDPTALGPPRRTCPRARSGLQPYAHPRLRPCAPRRTCPRATSGL